MTKDYPVSDDLRRSIRGLGGSWRPWFWALADWLQKGSIAVAFYLALRASLSGTAALAALIVGFSLRQVLEATSYGD